MKMKKLFLIVYFSIFFQKLISNFMDAGDKISHNPFKNAEAVEKKQN
jgi:hypothetical protein